MIADDDEAPKRRSRRGPARRNPPTAKQQAAARRNGDHIHQVSPLEWLTYPIDHVDGFTPRPIREADPRTLADLRRILSPDFCRLSRMELGVTAPLVRDAKRGGYFDFDQARVCLMDAAPRPDGSGVEYAVRFQFWML